MLVSIGSVPDYAGDDAEKSCNTISYMMACMISSLTAVSLNSNVFYMSIKLYNFIHIIFRTVHRQFGPIVRFINKFVICLQCFFLQILSVMLQKNSDKNAVL